MTNITIPTGERGTTRVFSLSMPPAEARLLTDDPAKQQALLGADGLNAAGVEVFPVSDLGEIGLAGYLREGVDAQEPDLTRDRAKLASLDGWVMLVHSLAFPDRGATLTPDAALTLIGTYRQSETDAPPIELEAATAQPYTGTANPATLPTRPRGSGSSIVVAGLVIIALLILWAVLN